MPVSAVPRLGATPKPLPNTFQSMLESYLAIMVTSLPSPPHNMPETGVNNLGTTTSDGLLMTGSQNKRINTKNAQTE